MFSRGINNILIKFRTHKSKKVTLNGTSVDDILRMLTGYLLIGECLSTGNCKYDSVIWCLISFQISICRWLRFGSCNKTFHDFDATHAILHSVVRIAMVISSLSTQNRHGLWFKTIQLLYCLIQNYKNRWNPTFHAHSGHDVNHYWCLYNNDLY